MPQVLRYYSGSLPQVLRYHALCPVVVAVATLCLLWHLVVFCRTRCGTTVVLCRTRCGTTLCLYLHLVRWLHCHKSATRPWLYSFQAEGNGRPTNKTTTAEQGNNKTNKGRETGDKHGSISLSNMGECGSGLHANACNTRTSCVQV